MDLFDPDEYLEIIRQVKLLNNINIKNDDVVDTIKRLDSLISDFDDFLRKDQCLDEDDIDAVTNLYLKYLSILKKNDGINFYKAQEAINVCLRLIPFFLGFLYDYHKFYYYEPEIPEEMKDIIRGCKHIKEETF